MAARPSFSGILSGRNRPNLEKMWEATAPANDLTPIPPGIYKCRITQGELHVSARGTPGFRLTFHVLDGDYTGRRLWHTNWLTEAALEFTKRDLAKLGIHQLADLERPFPTDRIVQARVAMRSTDEGSEFNTISYFDLLAIEPVPADPFAPVEPSISEDDTRTTEETEGSSTP